MAQALAVVLIERVPRPAALASAPTWSTPGRPCRNRLNVSSLRVMSEKSVTERPPIVMAILLSMVGELVTRPSIGLRHDDWGNQAKGRVMSQDASAGEHRVGYTEKFPPTSGRVMGVLAVGLAVAVCVYAIVDGGGGFEAPVAWGAAFAAVVSYASLLRPAVRVEAGALLLRNMVDTNVIPLAAIDEVAVGRCWRSARTRSATSRRPSGNSFFRTIRPKTGRDGESELTYPDYVRDRILHLADGARRRARPGEPPTRTASLGLAGDRRPGGDRARVRGSSCSSRPRSSFGSL